MLWKHNQSFSPRGILQQDGGAAAGRLVPCPRRWSAVESTSGPATAWCRYQPSRERTLSTFCASGNRRGFLSSWLGNIKQELAENKEMKENIKKKKKFWDEARKPGGDTEPSNRKP